jgi:ubiquinone/menaquinone biosynthesis C-methylase UbiE
MSVVKSILMRAFGHPQGVLGRVGGIIMARMNRSIAVRTIALLDVQPHDRVLEVGFGPGVGITLLVSVVSSGRVAGVDDSAEMVEQARARNAEAMKAGRVELQRGSVETLPFAHETFDKALAVNSMQVWPDAVTGLREIRRVLKPGGRVALGFTRHSGQPKEGLADVLTAAGFTGAHVVDIDQNFCGLATKT